MSRHNNFDCIRLFAALLVLFSHSFPLSGAPDPIWQFGYGNGGSIGVAIFFVMSGYLVAGSVSRHSTADYLTSRALRLVPALALVSVFDVFVIGPAFTTHSLAFYFSDGGTWSHLLNPMIFRINLFLPGVFETVPAAGANGSLWTLPAECTLYLIFPLAAFCGMLTKRGSLVICAVCAIGLFIATGYFGLDSWTNRGPQVVQHLLTYDALNLSTFFFAGAALWANRETIPLNIGGAIICCIALFASMQTASAPLVYHACLPYLVIFVAFKTPVISLAKIGDLSYGVYVFAWPVQQALVSTFGAGHPLRLTAMAVPIVLALAALSWRFVEKPALRLRNHKTATVITMPAVAA